MKTTNCEKCGEPLEVYECSRTETSSTVPHRPSQCIALLRASLESAVSRNRAANARAEEAELQAEIFSAHHTRELEIAQEALREADQLRAELAQERERADAAERHIAQDPYLGGRISLAITIESLERQATILRASLAQEHARAARVDAAYCSLRADLARKDVALREIADSHPGSQCDEFAWIDGARARARNALAPAATKSEPKRAPVLIHRNERGQTDATLTVEHVEEPSTSPDPHERAARVWDSENDSPLTPKQIHALAALLLARDGETLKRARSIVLTVRTRCNESGRMACDAIEDEIDAEIRALKRPAPRDGGASR